MGRPGPVGDGLPARPGGAVIPSPPDAPMPPRSSPPPLPALAALALLLAAPRAVRAGSPADAPDVHCRAVPRADGSADPGPRQREAADAAVLACLRGEAALAAGDPVASLLAFGQAGAAADLARGRTDPARAELAAVVAALAEGEPELRPVRVSAPRPGASGAPSQVGGPRAEGPAASDAAPLPPPPLPLPAAAAAGAAALALGALGRAWASRPPRPRVGRRSVPLPFLPIGPPRRPDEVRGREAEVRAVLDAIASEGAAVIHGEPGSGRSWMLHAVLHRLGTATPADWGSTRGVLVSAADPEGLGAALARALAAIWPWLGAGPPSGTADLSSRLDGALHALAATSLGSGRARLVVLVDDADALTSAARGEGAALSEALAARKNGIAVVWAARDPAGIPVAAGDRPPRIPVGPMDDEAISEVLEGATGGGLSPDVVTRVAALSLGYPAVARAILATAIALAEEERAEALGPAHLDAAAPAVLEAWRSGGAGIAPTPRRAWARLAEGRVARIAARSLALAAACSLGGPPGPTHAAEGAFAPVVQAGHLLPAAAWALSPDGAVAATASPDGTARIWTADGTLLRVLRPCEKGVTAVAFGDVSGTLATGDACGQVVIWDPSTGREAARGWIGQPVAGVAPLPGGRDVLIAPQGAAPEIRDVATLSRARRLQAPSGEISGVDGLALWGDDTAGVTVGGRTAWAWSLGDGTLLAALPAGAPRWSSRPPKGKAPGSQLAGALPAGTDAPEAIAWPGAVGWTAVPGKDGTWTFGPGAGTAAPGPAVESGAPPVPVPRSRVLAALRDGAAWLHDPRHPGEARRHRLPAPRQVRLLGDGDPGCLSSVGSDEVAARWCPGDDSVRAIWARLPGGLAVARSDGRWSAPPGSNGVRFVRGLVARPPAPEDLALRLPAPGLDPGAIPRVSSEDRAWWGLAALDRIAATRDPLVAAGAWPALADAAAVAGADARRPACEAAVRPEVASTLRVALAEAASRSPVAVAVAAAGLSGCGAAEGLVGEAVAALKTAGGSPGAFLAASVLAGAAPALGSTDSLRDLPPADPGTVAAGIREWPLPVARGLAAARWTDAARRAAAAAIARSAPMPWLRRGIGEAAAELHGVGLAGDREGADAPGRARTPAEASAPPEDPSAAPEVVRPGWTAALERGLALTVRWLAGPAMLLGGMAGGVLLWRGRRRGPPPGGNPLRGAAGGREAAVGFAALAASLAARGAAGERMVVVGSRGSGRSALLRAVARAAAAGGPAASPVTVDLGGLDGEDALRHLCGSVALALGAGASLPRLPDTADGLARVIPRLVGGRGSGRRPAILMIDRLETARRWSPADRARLRALLSGAGPGLFGVVAASIPGAGDPDPQEGSPDDVLGAPTARVPTVEDAAIRGLAREALRGGWRAEAGALDAVAAASAGIPARALRLLEGAVDAAIARRGRGISAADVDRARGEVDATAKLAAAAAGDADLPETPQEALRALGRAGLRG